MDAGDWIQLLIIILVFLIAVVIIYSFFMWALWVSILLMLAVVIAGYIANRFIQ